MTIPEAVKQLLAIVEALRKAYPKKRFTLDGRLVGDIGEVLAEQEYDISLFEDFQKHHDAKASDGRLVQVKATMQRSLTFPADHVPDYYLGIQIRQDGSFREVFNGPGGVAREAVRNRKPTKNNLHSISISALLELSGKVKLADRIPGRHTSG
ncbi:MAG: hypothetical protein FJ288_18625 [Planctomycetes bacterium]|nr:hypothetical protein [Planctomycetota bacterium]